MNIIFLIILTILCLIAAIIGMFILINVMLMGISSMQTLSWVLFLLGTFGLIYIGMSIITNDTIFIKETICSYTVGKNDEVCIDNYTPNFNFSINLISDLIGIIYIFSGITFWILLVRKIMIDFSNAIQYDR